MKTLRQVKIEKEIANRRTNIEYDISEFIEEWGWDTALAVIRAVLGRIAAYNSEDWNRRPDLNRENTTITFVKGRDGEAYITLSYKEAQSFAKRVREIRDQAADLLTMAEYFEEEAGKRFSKMLNQEAVLDKEIASRRSSSG